jgi:HD-like signal output (HDOD) protein
MLDLEDAILALVARDEIVIPPYPAVALRLAETVQRGGYGLADLGRIVSADEVLSADVLRCANSGLYARGAAATTLQQAVTRIGGKEIARLAVASALAVGARAPGPLAGLKRRVWQRSVASAVVSEALGAKRGLSKSEAFLCGLLHDFGLVIALTAVEDLLARHQHQEMAPLPESSWNDLIERLHVELGFLLATRWKLPAIVIEAITMMHQPTRGESPFAAMLEVIAASDDVVALLGQRAGVTERELAAISMLRSDERPYLAQLLPSIPSFIVSFEQEPSQARPLPSKVAPPTTTLPEGFRAIDARIDQLKPKKQGPYTMIGLASTGWLMTGAEPIADNSLIEVCIDARGRAAPPDGPPQPVTMWARATLCAKNESSTQGDYRIECKAFALNGPSLAIYNELFRIARRL